MSMRMRVQFVLPSRTLLAVALCLGAPLVALPGCSDDDDDHPDGQVLPDAAGDGQAVSDGGADAGPCLHEGALGAACEDDCGCVVGLACRGFTGAMACAVPCEDHPDCETAPLGCEVKTCELSLGACRCPCQGEDCGDDVCFAGYCVGCARDEDCAAHSCGPELGLDQPRCRQDLGECVCGGACGDAVCDPAEEAALSCPADCVDCTVPDTLVASCSDGARVPYCACESGDGTALWDCTDPWAACTGDTRCAQEGGFCVAAQADCFEGTVSATPLGCEGVSPLCCAADPCTPAGDTYYPANGRCCPGLRALASVAPMTGMVTGVAGAACYPGCWAMICAPCGDGVCQLHLSENPCNCPEDCPWPPAGFVCDAEGFVTCGRASCSQEGTACRQVTPRCESNACERDVAVVEGAVCDRVTDSCVVP